METVDSPARVERHANSEGYARGEPGQARPQEGPDKP